MKRAVSAGNKQTEDEQIRSDFQTDKTVLVDGWILSVTEARQSKQDFMNTRKRLRVAILERVVNNTRGVIALDWLKRERERERDQQSQPQQAVRGRAPSSWDAIASRRWD